MFASITASPANLTKPFSKNSYVSKSPIHAKSVSTPANNRSLRISYGENNHKFK